MTDILGKWIPRRGYTIYYKILFILATIIALFSPKWLSIALSYTITIEVPPAEITEQIEPIIEEPLLEEKHSIKKMVETEFGVGHIMNRVAFCESNFRQHNEDGEPLYNASGSTSVGVFQIMTSYHLERAEELNLDIINDPLDNIAFAIILYNESGLKPWEASKLCWGKLN